jgi:hypothetical protein
MRNLIFLCRGVSSEGAVEGEPAIPSMNLLAPRKKPLTFRTKPILRVVAARLCRSLLFKVRMP